MTKALLLFVSTDDYEPEFGIDGYQGSYNSIKAATQKLNEIEYFDSAQLLEMSEDGLYMYAEHIIQYEDESDGQRVRTEGWKMNDGVVSIVQSTKQIYIPPLSPGEWSKQLGFKFSGATIIGPQGRWENAK